MPYKIEKNAGGKTFKVINSDTGKVHAKKTSEKNAKAQLRLLYMKAGDEAQQPMGKKGKSFLG
jgi:endonuclease YncB( thermonuclease family)